MYRTASGKVYECLRHTAYATLFAANHKDIPANRLIIQCKGNQLSGSDLLLDNDMLVDDLLSAGDSWCVVPKTTTGEYAKRYNVDIYTLEAAPPDRMVPMITGKVRFISPQLQDFIEDTYSVLNQLKAITLIAKRK